MEFEKLLIEFSESDSEYLTTVQEYSVDLQKAYTMNNQKRADVVMFKVLEGSLMIESSRPKITVQKGEYGFIGSHFLHNVIVPKGKLHIKIIIIHFSFIMSTVPTTTLFHQIIKLEHHTAIDQCFEAIISNLSIDSINGVLAFRGSLYLLLSEVANAIFAVDDLKHHQLNKRIYEITQYVEHNCEKKITLEDLSIQFKYTPQYISFLFKKELSTTFYHYLTYKRLKKGLFLLNTTTSSVIDIAYASGFSNERAFVKFFKQRYGITPSQYRTNLKAKLQEVH